MAIKVYGIPTCGTVKKARKWLDTKEVEYSWIDLREHAPEPKRVERWFKKFGAKPMKNTSGGAYRNLGPEKKSWSDEEWLDAFKKDVMLLKRPIIEVSGKPVTVGFKEAVYEELFG